VTGAKRAEQVAQVAVEGADALQERARLDREAADATQATHAAAEAAVDELA
jgi:hypothetical protein